MATAYMCCGAAGRALVAIADDSAHLLLLKPKKARALLQVSPYEI